ncbi:hypothetical protein SNE40_016804 [Patella caerulea]|uniref:Uncharacterized protein n=1 Tax=Patella caerulea TaxID=87958 RepID=A0AAN8JEZ9_PATCE
MSSKAIGKSTKVVYPPGCKEINEELSKDELVKRLKLLARAFQDMSQDENAQFSGLALMLASEFFTDHQNKDVRLLVACCIADVFRVFAPEAPFNDNDQLKEIFLFLIKQLRGLEDPESPSFKRYFYLLENLAWVKSFNICIELEDNQEIFRSLFKLMFSIVSDKHSNKVKNFMLDMMGPLISESDSVSPELLDTILINVVEPQKSQNKCAYNLAKDLLRRTSNAIEPYIQAFFNNTLMLGKTSKSDVSNHLYDLIYELNQISPNVLLAVLPQLEFKLKSNEEPERKNVTKLLAKMFSEPESNLASQNKPLWICFLGRFNDISISVRTICVQYAQYFFLHHPELTKEILEQLKVRQHDQEETVRVEVVNCILNVAKKDFDCLSMEMFAFIKERTRDKKFKIRRDALLGLGQMYKHIMSQEPREEHNVAKVAWIRDKVFHAYYQQSNDDRLLVERIFNIYLVPYQILVQERMQRLLQLYCQLDENAVKAMREMFKHRSNARLSTISLLEGYDLADQPNAPAILPRLTALARSLPEQQKPQEQLKKFNIILRDDRRMRNLLKMIISPECTCKKAEEIVKEVLRKLGFNSGGPNHLYNMVKSLLERIAPVMIDTEAIDVLVKHIDDVITGKTTLEGGIDNAPEKGVNLLLGLSQAFPHYFRTADVFERFLSFLKQDDDVVCGVTLQILNHTGARIQTMHPNIYTDMVPVLVSIAKMGNPKQTKHAIRCISTICAQNKANVLGQIFEHVKKNLHPDSANYINSIVALGHIAQLCPEEFGGEMKNIVSKIIVKDLMMHDRTSGPETDESWYADHLVTEETQAKIQALKLLVRWLKGLKNNSFNSGTLSTLRLLYTVIIHDGDLMENGNINKPELARLRLQAGCCMLKLAEEPGYAEMVTSEQFLALALLIIDSCYNVRLKFAAKLHKGLLLMKLPLEYMSIFSLGANDPLKERRVQLKQFLHINVQKRREYLKHPGLRKTTQLMTTILPDYVLPYTIHLLAHDPDLKTFDNRDALKNIKECLYFIMEPLIGRAEDYNYAFLRKMIENIKQTKDAMGPDNENLNKKLYAVCDVALGIMLSKTNITLKDCTFEPQLPSKLFTTMDKDYSNTKSYLPKDFNFDAPKRKGIQALIDGPSKSNSAKLYTTTEIIVESPAPVINRNPKSPRTKREKKVTEKKTDKGKENIKKDDTELLTEDEESRNDSITSESEESRNSSPEIQVQKTRKTKTKTASASSSETKNNNNVKAGTKQTKMDDFSSAGASSKPSKSLVNGSTKDTKGGKKTKTVNISDSENSNVSGSTRKRQASSDEETPVKRTRRGEETDKSRTAAKTQVVKNVSPELSGSDSESGPSTRGSSRKRAVSPPPQKTLPPKKSRVTRKTVRDSSESCEILPSSSSDILDSSPVKSDTRRSRSTPTSTSAKKNTRYVRKAKTNGTSDGEDANTPETDSQSSLSPRKIAILKQAMETGDMDSQPTIKRQTRGRKK